MKFLPLAVTVLVSETSAFASLRSIRASQTPLLTDRLPFRSTALLEREGPPGYPNAIIYPGDGWGLSKPKPKDSLYPDADPDDPVDQHNTAKTWILNIIEFAHWISFPIGFRLFWLMFKNSTKLGAAIAPDHAISCLFFLILAHMCQVFGGGISGNLMHQYEGWQVAVFRNPLQPYENEKEPGYNNAWLRSVAYQMLFSFQTLGVLFTAGAIYGWDGPGMKLLGALSGLVIALAPQLPHCTTVFPNLMNKLPFGVGTKIWNLLTCGGRPVFPLSVYLFGTFLVNSMVAIAAYITMFSKITWGGWIGTLPKWLPAVFPFGLIGAGGIYEGLRAETTFNQWDHLLAFVMLDLGLWLHIPFYLKLIS